MSYTKNPHMPKVRRDAANMVRRGYSKEEVGRRYGVSGSTICKWVKKAKIYGFHPIPTKSSRPHHHPKQLSDDLIWKIFQTRIKNRRCAEVVHQELINQGIKTSLSSVKRTLDRHGLLKKRSPWKRLYVFVLIDVYSRWIYAKCYKKMNSKICLNFVREAQKRHLLHLKCCKVTMDQSLESIL